MICTSRAALMWWSQSKSIKGYPTPLLWMETLNTEKWVPTSLTSGKRKPEFLFWRKCFLPHKPKILLQWICLWNWVCRRKNYSKKTPQHLVVYWLPSWWWRDRVSTRYMGSQRSLANAPQCYSESNIAATTHLCLLGGWSCSGSLLLAGGGPQHFMRRHNMVRFGPSMLQLFLAGVAPINYFWLDCMFLSSSACHRDKQEGWGLVLELGRLPLTRSAPDFWCGIPEDFPLTLCFVLRAHGSGTESPKHIWKHLNA